MISGPHVVVDASWPRAADVPPPKISDSAGAEIADFAAFREGPATITHGCVATPIPGWVEDMRPAVEGRTVALAGASAALASGHPIDARSDGHGGFALRAVSHLEEPPIGNAKTFVGFDNGHVFTCFATCIGAPCRAAVEDARLEGSAPPPRPGLALGAVTWAVHHPRPFAAGAGILFIVAGILAVVLRRRPRFSML